MKRYLQLLGEMKNYQLPQAKRAVQEIAPGDELVIVVPEQSVAQEIQQWATSQGYTVPNPKKSVEGITRWSVTVQKPAAPAEQPTAGPATAPA